MKYTAEQLMSINETGKRIVVKASAGSGKTGVLSERIFKKIKEGISVNSLVVVTFTKLAAEEMKERVKKKLVKYYEETKDEHIYNQILLIDDALITTIDGFCKYIVNHYGDLLDINPGYKVMDINIYDKVLSEIATELIVDTEYKNFLDAFLDVNKLSVGTSVLVKFYKEVDKYPFSDLFIEKIEDIYYNDDSIFEDFLNTHILQIIECGINELEYYKTNFTNNSDKVNDLINEDIALFNKLLKSSDTNSLASITLSRFKSDKDEKEDNMVMAYKDVRKSYEKTIKQLASIYKLKSVGSVKDVMKDIIKLYTLLKEKMDIYQKETINYTFNDIAKGVLKGLVSDYNADTDTFTKTELASLISANFEEILIDEFQDTNLLQDLIFRSISRDESNIFLVGDVKQSIYKFRGADPKVMLKYTNQINEAFVIGLDKNFRSRSEVLEFTNILLTKVMTKDNSSMVYNKDESLKLGFNYNNNTNMHPVLNIIESSNDDNEFYELNFIAHKIDELIESKMEVYDSEDNIYRPIKYKDIAVLFNSPKSFVNDIFRIFTNKGINIKTENPPALFDNYEIKLLVSFISFFSDYNETALVSILRSPMFAYTLNDLYKLKNEESMLTNVLETSDAFKKFFIKFSGYKNNYSLPDFINKLVFDTSFLKFTNSISNKDIRQHNVLEFINISKNYASLTLKEFVELINDMIKENKKMDISSMTSSDNSVTITSVHKSKGLEFPVVFYAGLNKQINFMDLKNKISANELLGVSINSDNNFYSEVMKLALKKEIIDEQFRLIYVALTRAREKLYLSLTNKDASKLLSKNINNGAEFGNFKYISNCRTPFELMLPGILTIDPSLSGLTSSNRTTSFKLETNVYKESDIELIEEVEKFDLKNEKLDLSDINFYKKEELITPKFLSPGAQMGTLTHEFMENIDFLADITSIKEELEKNKLNPNIINFFESNFFKDIIKTGIISKEKTIYFMKDKVAKTGIIDLLVETSDKYYIIDYKTDKISPNLLIEHYKEQISNYESAFKNKPVEKYIYSFYNNKFINLGN